MSSSVLCLSILYLFSLETVSDSGTLGLQDEHEFQKDDGESSRFESDVASNHIDFILFSMQ